ncbi:MAG: SRPBCC family protein [Candidatus Ranarchaeia archaeon]|jgi:hypothetical protein
MILSDSIFIRAPLTVVFSLAENSTILCDLMSKCSRVEEGSPPQLGRKTRWFSPSHPKVPKLEVITGYRPPKYLTWMLYDDIKQDKSILKGEFSLEETPEGNTTLQLMHTYSDVVQEEDIEKINQEIRQVLAGIKIIAQKRIESLKSD